MVQAAVTLHSIIVRTQQDLLNIAFSNEYTVAFSENRITIDPAAKRKLPRSLNHEIASLHTLFGANGSGKTAIMLRIAEALGMDGEMNISVHFERANELYFYSAPDLNGYRLGGTSKTKRTKVLPHIASVFYTSSPYEWDRRQRLLERAGCLDVSPRYGSINQLDGLALLEVKDLLGRFMKHAQIGISANLIPLAEIGELLSLAYTEKIDDLDLGSMLKALLYSLPRRSMAQESLRLRVLCSIADIRLGDSKLARMWPSLLAESLIWAIGNLLSDEPSRHDSMALRRIPHIRRQKIFWDMESRFHAAIKGINKDADGIIATLEALSNWTRQRKRSEIQATPDTFAKNIKDRLNDHASLERCSALGLVRFSLAQLSSGETALAVFSAALHGALSKLEGTPSRRGPVLLLIDEGEMFLHPKWQREYIGSILKLMAQFPKISKRSHVLLSSHSLIVAADTPPNCLIDIEHGRTLNGFGLGPKSLLHNVYEVDELSGAYTNPALTQLADYFGNGGQKISKPEAILTAEALADDNIRTYLVGKIEEERH
ncbi:ATP-binding protein [Janthinobacterium sp. GW460P]|uniref:AAA family ATPase n=1 Tax=unclassified Janthinobacterium TaxID=2610881 RepID=UPI000A323F4A|nr:MULTISPECIES: AAA family ATPase [unclassified Janthinobacterium]MCC7706011.1 ATP-binding protein [Janthinobacterium sp. GW460P]MCC7711513.1 ATP-binding protein [Janthinobacterium sp. GW460W]